jgi:hypothetical protein
MSTKGKLFSIWLNFGVKRKWVTYPVCDTHEWLDMTEEELDQFDEGGDPCILAIRVW